MKIRKAIRTDSDSIIELLSQYDREPDPRPSDTDIDMVFSSFLDRLDGIFVCEIDNKIAGTFQLVITPQLNHTARPFAVIENIIVDSFYRRQGIGKAMMSKATQMVEDAGCSKVILLSGKQRPYNHQFYAACGFTGNKVGFQIRFGL